MKTILYIEPYTERREEISNYLLDAGFDLFVAASLDEAKQYREVSDFDLIICDAGQQVLTGEGLEETVTALRETVEVISQVNVCFDGVPLVLMSADLAPVELESMLTAGVAGTIHCPVHPRDLLEIICGAIEDPQHEFMH